MARFPEYVGPVAFGVTMGVIVPKMDLVGELVNVAKRCVKDDLIADGDILCITESIVARAQNNFVTLEQIAVELTDKLQLKSDSRLGVVFPILSRNRFMMILEAFARAVPKGEIIVQLSWPSDEVGNQIISESVANELGKNYYDVITEEEIGERDLLHPITEIDYAKLYRRAIEQQGAKAQIYFANDPKAIAAYNCDGVIAADIHTRKQTKAKLANIVTSLITLVDICSDPNSDSWSEWGLLGSNMSAGGKLKLAPKNASAFADQVQTQIKQLLNTDVEVLVYGDGAYKDPSTGIYELADPQPVFGATSKIEGLMREGVKYKYLADLGYASGKSPTEIEEELKQHKSKKHKHSQLVTEGTTPRPLGDIVASLADLVSGSADAGTPLIVVKGFMGKK